NKDYWSVPICFGLWLLYRAAFPKPKAAAVDTVADSGGVTTSRFFQFAWQLMGGVLMISIFAIVFFSYVVVLSADFVYSERNFFGVKFVNKVLEGIALVSGNTVHGL